MKPLFYFYAGVKEYCENESFHAKCAHDEVIVMTSAVYGRMRIGKCITELFDHMPCQVNALDNMDKWCSGRRSCDLVVTMLVHDAPQPCPKDYRSYLEASYTCVPGTLRTHEMNMSIYISVNRRVASRRFEWLFGLFER